MHLARVVGRLVATQQYQGLRGVALQLIQPLDADGVASGDVVVACSAISSGPGDFVHWIDGREAALACPETFVPVDAAIIGWVEEAWAGGRRLAP
jgi:microcompartment protein CcmK/EutM